MTEPGMAGAPGSVERAVARERLRTRLVLATFLVLLAVAVGLTAWVHLFGRSEKEVVRAQINERFEEQFEPLTAALANVQGVSGEIEKQNAAVKELREKQVDLDRRLSPVVRRLPDIESKAAAAAELRNRLTEVGARVERQEAETRGIREQQTRVDATVRGLSQRVDRISVGGERLSPEEVRRLRQEVRELRGEVNQLRRQVPQRPRIE